MTEHQNRAERRSFQVIELRRIRSEFKKHNKSLPEGSTYNTKKFRKTLFYYNLKKQTGSMGKKLIMISGTSCSGPSTNTEIISNQSEVSDSSNSFVSEEQIQNSLGQDNENIAVSINHDLSSQEHFSMIVDENQMSDSEDIFDDSIHSYNIMATTNSQEEKEEEECYLLSDTEDQDEIYASAVDTYIEEVDQTVALVTLDDAEQAVEIIDVSDTFDNDLSIEVLTPVAFDITERTPECIHTIETPEEEESTSLPSGTLMSFTAGTDIPIAFTIEHSSGAVLSDDTPIEGNRHVSDVLAQEVNISEETNTKKENVGTNVFESEAKPISVDKKEGDIVEATLCKTGTITVISDEEQRAMVKEDDIKIDLKSFMLESGTDSSPGRMFDGTLDVEDNPQIPDNAAEPEATETSDVVEALASSPLTGEKKKILKNLRNKAGAIIPKIKKLWKKI